MPLSDLPREILLDIADQLDDAWLNSLANTNSQMYQFLNKYLYHRDVTSVKSRSLTWAIRNGVEATVQRVVDTSGHLYPIPESFHIALQDAAYRGHVNFVAALLKLDGINPNFCNEQRPPLHLAALQGHSAVVNLLLAVSNINPNFRDRHDGITDLCLPEQACIRREAVTRSR